MRTSFAFAVACLAVARIQAQFLDNTNVDRMVPRAQVVDKSSICASFDYFTTTAADGTQMVDRASFVRIVPGFRPFPFSCAAGTLYSLASTECGCTVLIIVEQNRDRCISVTGNMQGEDDFLTGTQRNNAAVNSVDNVQYTVEGFFNAAYIVSENCYASNVNTPLMIPFFHYNSLAQVDLDFMVGFRLPSGTTNAPFTIVTNGACADDTAASSFDVSYVRSGPNTGQIILTLRVLSNQVANSAEQEVRINCAIGNLNRPGGAVYNFNENAPDNYIRIVGQTRSPNAFTIALRNDEIDASTDPTPPPSDGFCSRSVTGTLSRRGRNMIIAPRRCPLMIGQAPSDQSICIYRVSLRRDCSQ